LLIFLIHFSKLTILFSFFKINLNFAFNTSSFDLSQALEKGLVNTQGIDSDIDYIKKNR